MKQVRGVLALCLMACLCMLPVQAASAETFAVNGGSITVQSKILKTHYILIDDQSTITQITSNTNEAAKPRVFLQKVALDNERPMTQDIYKQYHTIIPTGRTHVGTVYKHSELSTHPLFLPGLRSNDSSILAFIKQ